MTTHTITVLPGDGIGPEIVNQSLRVLDVVTSNISDKAFIIQKAPIGGAAFDAHGEHLPQSTLQLAKDCDAILFGAVGGPVSDAHLPKWRNCEKNSILGIRKAFSFHANFRPAKVYPQLRGGCPLKSELVKSGIDLLIIRELLGGIYFGTHETTSEMVAGGETQRVARDICEYSEAQIAAIAHSAFQAAQKRDKRVISVDKANVLDTSKLWRDVVSEIHGKYCDVSLEHMLVDNCAMQIIQNPAQFDVILTSNMFGDILSDAAAVLPGSLGLTPSASFNSDGFAMYEPSGGSAPDIANKGVANPTAQILCVAMMLRFSFQMESEAAKIERAIEHAFNSGVKTADISTEEETPVSTKEFTDCVIDFLKD